MGFYLETVMQGYSKKSCSEIFRKNPHLVKLPAILQKVGTPLQVFPLKFKTYFRTTCL